MRLAQVCPVLGSAQTKEHKVRAACALQSRVSADTCEAGVTKVGPTPASRQKGPRLKARKKCSSGGKIVVLQDLW